MKQQLDYLAEASSNPLHKKMTIAWSSPTTNPFRTLPKDAPARATRDGPSNRVPSGPGYGGGHNNSGGNYSGGNYGGGNYGGGGGNFRGRGNYGGPRGNMNQGGYNRNFSGGGGGGMGGGYNNNNNMGFNNGPMGGGSGGNFAFNRGGMMGGMRGGPGGMRGGRGGMGGMGGGMGGMGGNMGAMGGGMGGGMNNGMMGGGMGPMGGMPMAGMPGNMGPMGMMGPGMGTFFFLFCCLIAWASSLLCYGITRGKACVSSMHDAVSLQCPGMLPCHPRCTDVHSCLAPLTECLWLTLANRLPRHAALQSGILWWRQPGRRRRRRRQWERLGRRQPAWGEAAAARVVQVHVQARVWPNGLAW